MPLEQGLLMRNWKDSSAGEGYKKECSVSEDSALRVQNNRAKISGRDCAGWGSRSYGLCLEHSLENKQSSLG